VRGAATAAAAAAAAVAIERAEPCGWLDPGTYIDEALEAPPSLSAERIELATPSEMANSSDSFNIRKASLALQETRGDLRAT
jgi:hypothetical protein